MFNIIDSLEEIDFLSLTQNGKSYNPSMLSVDWYHNALIKIDDVYILLLTNDKRKAQGCWYFNENREYAASDISQLSDTYKKKLKSFSMLLFDSVVKSFTNSAHSNDVEFFIKNKFFISQLGALLGEAIATDIRPSIYGILDDNFRVSQDLFIKRTHITYSGVSYYSPVSIILGNFGFAYIYFSSDNKNFLIIFESKHFAVRVGFFSSVHTKLVVTDKSFLNLMNIFLNHICNHYFDLKEYFLAPNKKTVAVFRNSHIGHNLWNDLTGLDRLADNSFENISEIILYGGEKHEVYAPIYKLVNIPEKVAVNRNILTNGDLAPYIYKNKLYAVRIADDYIKESLANNIIKYSNLEYQHIKKNKDTLTVVVGLRFENRTWANQVEGVLTICKHLTSKYLNVVVIIDGHDYSGHSMVKVSSHLETESSALLSKEKSLFEDLQLHLNNDDNIKIITSIDNDIREAITLINSADFFVSPWGAGLAKYKWICNKPGIVFTNNWNIEHKGDLHIYDQEQYRENAIASRYLNTSYISDLDVKEANTIIPLGMEKAYSNFVVDVVGLISEIDKLIYDLKIDSLLHEKKDK